MRQFIFILLLAITTVFIVLLSRRLGDLPPLGRLLDPVDGFWANARRVPLPQSLQSADLKNPVQVYLDANDIPHIVAQNDWDLYWAQGYVTAYHRLWQMEFQITKTAGRLSEVLGEITENLDRRQRRYGLGYAAERMLEHMKKNPTTYQMFQAYSQGINAYIQSLDYADYPLEYKLLDYAPQPWSPYKSCLLVKEMADILSTDNKDIENNNLRAQLGDKMFALLFDNVLVDPIAPAGTPFDFTPVVSDTNLAPLEDSLQLPYPLFDNHKELHGSNQVVVGPSLSASGNPLVANEPDLDLGLPSLWYLTHLVHEGDNFHTMGGSLPGLPGVVIGFNDSIAWGLTNANRDLVDWYAISFVNDARKEYLYDNQYYKTEKRVEKIIIRDKGVLYDTVVYTHYGPVVYDRNFGYDHQSKSANLALHWTGHLPSDDWYSIYLLNRARNYDDFKQAIPYLQAPPQNVCVGTAGGDIALWAQGRYPIKRIGQGKLVQDGTSARHQWQGFIPQIQAIHRENPPEGFLSSANEAPAYNEDYPYPIYWYNFERYRSRRLRDRLQTMQHIRPEDLIVLQNDNFNLVAYEALPLMLDSIQRSILNVEESKIYKAIQDWVFFNTPSSVAAVYFDIWFSTFFNILWDEYSTWSGPKYQPSIYKTIELLRTQPMDFAFYDIQKTRKKEQAGDLIRQSFKNIAPTITKWRKKNPQQSLTWGSYKNTTIRHLLRIPPFGVSTPVGGGQNIINAIKKHHGPSLRLVVQLSKQGSTAWAIYPGSQTGHVGHPTYAQWVNQWATQDYLPLLFDKPETLEANTVSTHRLLPE